MIIQKLVVKHTFYLDFNISREISTFCFELKYRVLLCGRKDWRRSLSPYTYTRKFWKFFWTKDFSRRYLLMLTMALHANNVVLYNYIALLQWVVKDDLELAIDFALSLMKKECCDWTAWRNCPFFYHGLYKRCAVLLQVASDCCTNEEIMQKITAI